MLFLENFLLYMSFYEYVTFSQNGFSYDNRLTHSWSFNTFWVVILLSISIISKLVSFRNFDFCYKSGKFWVWLKNGDIGLTGAPLPPDRTRVGWHWEAAVILMESFAIVTYFEANSGFSGQATVTESGDTGTVVNIIYWRGELL